MTRHEQIFFKQTDTADSLSFYASSDNINRNNNVSIFVYGDLNGGNLKLQGKPLVNNQETNPDFEDIVDPDGSSITFFAGSLLIIELISGVEYRLSFTGSGADFSTQVIYDK